MKTQGIYLIRNVHTNETYIGSSVDVRRRWADHKRELTAGIHKNALLSEAWEEWGHSAFRLETLELVADRDDLEAREQSHLDFLKPAYNEVMKAARAPLKTWRNDAADEARFWTKVNQAGDGCWLWQGTVLRQGYGCFKIAGKMHRAHRLAYQYTKGAIAPGLLISHKCDNPRCVRPDHLFLGTHKDNAVDRDMKRRGYFCSPESKLHKAPLERHHSHLHPEKFRGELNPRARLTREQVETIPDRYERKEASQFKLAAEYGVAQTTISAIVRRANWRH